jgi:phosphoribosylamine---glycine ligase
VLYAGLMLTEDGPRVLEFNCRFGDPETQALLPRIDGDLLAARSAAAAGNLEAVELQVAPRAAVTVVVAGGEYPERNDTGAEIEGTAAAQRAGALVFHSGTARHGERLVTNGGRIVGVTGVADQLEDARTLAYEGAALISFAGARYRTDIARPEASRVG